MKALLLDDVPDLGKAGEVLEVDEKRFHTGLVPLGLAVLATANNLKLWAVRKTLPTLPRATPLRAARDACRPVSQSDSVAHITGTGKVPPRPPVNHRVEPRPETGTGIGRREIVRPGILEHIRLDTLTSTEQRIVRSLSAVWLITWAKTVDFKHRTYSYVFARPTTLLTDMFHLEHEVLVLLNTQSTIYGRACDLVDKLGQEFSRLDRLTVLFVSPEPDIQEKVAHEVRGSPESRIIVPFSYRELEHAPPEAQVDRIREMFFTRDLYSLSGPLKQDTYFFGRAEVLARMYDKYRTGENSGLFGLRKTGKTSVLFALKRQMSLRGEPLVFVDCHNPAVHMSRWNELLLYIVRQAVGQLEVTSKALHAPADYAGRNAPVAFEDDMREIQRAAGGNRLLLALDEIENITFDLSPSDHWAKERDFLYFWQSIRSVYQQNDGLLSIIVAGVNPRIVECSSAGGFDNPIYRFINTEYLPLFSLEGVKEMVASIGSYMGIRFEEDVFAFLVEDYGGHPYLIRHVCSMIHKKLPHPRPALVTKFAYRDWKPEFAGQVRDCVEQVLNVLREKYGEEYDMLEYLATGRHDDFHELLALSGAFVEHLRGYGLVVQHGANYHITVQAVAEYVRTQARLAKVLKTKEDRWAEISRKRNRLEAALRRTVELVLKANHAGGTGRDVFLDVVEQPRRTKLASFTLSQLLDGSTEVYFEDLRRVVLKNWADFEAVFRKKRDHFDRHMQFVNQHRADAHANTIEDDDFAILLAGLDWVYACVDDYLG